MKKEIISQYKASLKMLEDVINKCPEYLWQSDEYENSYWRIVYHTLFYSALYLSHSVDEFIPWVKHKANYNLLGTVTRADEPITIDEIYYKEELILYLKTIIGCCEDNVSETCNDTESGFYWLPMSKLELHLYNIRHIQHHTGQLIERLHHKGIGGINWESMNHES